MFEMEFSKSPKNVTIASGWLIFKISTVQQKIVSFAIGRSIKVYSTSVIKYFTEMFNAFSWSLF